MTSRWEWRCRLLTVKGAAEKTGVSPAMIYGWCASGRLVHLRLGGKNRRGSIRIAEDDLDAFLASCKQGERKEPPPVQKQPPLKLKHLQL